MHCRLRLISRGFTRVELLACLLAAAILVCWAVSATATSKFRRVKCSSNLKQSALAFMLWAENHNKQYPFQVSVAQGGTKEFVEAGPVSLHFSAISNDVGTFTVLACSSDKGRVPRQGIANLTDLNVSYFLNPGVRSDMPQGILAGDRNVTGGVARASNVVEFTAQSSPGWGKELHGPNGGYVALADGSVHETTTRNFRDLLPGAPGGTTRLIFPVGELPTSIVHQRLASKALPVLGAVAICGALVALVWFSLREPVKRET